MTHHWCFSGDTSGSVILLLFHCNTIQSHPCVRVIVICMSLHIKVMRYCGGKDVVCSYISSLQLLSVSKSFNRGACKDTYVCLSICCRFVLFCSVFGRSRVSADIQLWSVIDFRNFVTKRNWFLRTNYVRRTQMSTVSGNITMPL